MVYFKSLIFIMLVIFKISLADDSPKAVINLTTGDINKFR